MTLPNLAFEGMGKSTGISRELTVHSTCFFARILPSSEERRVQVREVCPGNGEKSEVIVRIIDKVRSDVLFELK